MAEYRGGGGLGGEVVASITVQNLTPDRLVYADATKKLQSVDPLTSWVAGTSDQVTVADDGDGTITISLPSAIITPGTLTVTGHTTPQANNTYDLGGSSFAWRNLYVGTQILAANGSAGAPSLSFSGDPDTGWFSNGTNIITVSTGGTGRWTFNGSGHMLAGSNNVYDIGASGANSPRSVYVVTSLFIGPKESGVISPQLGLYHAGQPVFVVRETGSNIELALFCTTANCYVSAATPNDLIFRTSNTDRWRIVNSEVGLWAGASTRTITGGVSDGYVSGVRLSPTYDAATAQTVTRHNYIDVEDVLLTGAGPAAVTDACVFRFNAAAGTHKALAGASTKTTPGAWDAAVKINVNGTIMYIPAYTSPTA